MLPREVFAPPGLLGSPNAAGGERQLHHAATHRPPRFSAAYRRSGCAHIGQEVAHFAAQAIGLVRQLIHGRLHLQRGCARFAGSLSNP